MQMEGRLNHITLCEHTLFDMAKTHAALLRTRLCSPQRG